VNVTKRIERGMVFCDMATRAGVVVLVAVVIGRVMDRSDGSDGLPSIAALPLVVYLAWNVAAIAWLGRLMRRPRRDVEARRFAWLLGGGAAVRVLWLLPVARDPYWRSPALFVLLAVTVITIAGATICASSADGHTAPGTP
jgi:hypothetical protein